MTKVQRTKPQERQLVVSTETHERARRKKQLCSALLNRTDLSLAILTSSSSCSSSDCSSSSSSSSSLIVARLLPFPLAVLLETLEAAPAVVFLLDLFELGAGVESILDDESDSEPESDEDMLGC
jgi:hypothetical protein